MSKLEYEVVPDERRAETSPGRNSALWNAVRAGQTVLVLDRSYADMRGAATSLRRQGYKLIVRTVDGGVLVWAEKLDAP